MENTCFSFLKNSITEHEDVPLSFFFLVISQPLVALSFLIYIQSLFSRCTQGIFLAFSRLTMYDIYVEVIVHIHHTWVCWDSWIYKLIFYTKFEMFLFIISLGKNYSVPFLLFLLSFCYILLYMHVELNFIYFELPDIVLLVSETLNFSSVILLCVFWIE